MPTNPGQKVECPFFPTATLRSCVAGYAKSQDASDAICHGCETGRARTIREGSAFAVRCIEEIADWDLMQPDDARALVANWMAVSVFDRWELARELELMSEKDDKLPMYVCEQLIFGRALQRGQLGVLALRLMELPERRPGSF